MAACLTDGVSEYPNPANLNSAMMGLPQAIADAGTHLHAGTLPPERESRTDRKQSTDEFDRDQAKRRLRQPV
jgi:hypothetical protein